MRYVFDPLPSSDPDASGASLEVLYRRHAQWLGRALRHQFGKTLSCEDLVQETYLRAARLPGCGSVQHPRALLWKIAQRIAFDQLRRRGRAERLAPPAGQSAPALQEVDVLMGELIAGLPLKVRESFVLSRFADLTYAEIAQRQGVSVKAVEWRISRALELLAARLAE